MSGSLYLEDVMLPANDGEREEGAGIRGVILWNEELEKDTQRLSWVGNEALREAREGTDQLGGSQGTTGSHSNLHSRNVLSIRCKRRV